MKDINFENEKQKDGTKMGILYPYRGKSLFSGDWVYGFLMWLGDWNTPYIVTHEDGPICGGDFVCKRVESLSVGRFIGVRDKNGQELYVGDVVKGVGL